MASTKDKRAGYGKQWVVAFVGVALYSVVTWAAVEKAGGTKIEPSNSNTPNHVVQSPPAFK